MMELNELTKGQAQQALRALENDAILEIVVPILEARRQQAAVDCVNAARLGDYSTSSHASGRFDGIMEFAALHDELQRQLEEDDIELDSTL